MPMCCLALLTVMSAALVAQPVRADDPVSVAPPGDTTVSDSPVTAPVVEASVPAATAAPVDDLAAYRRAYDGKWRIGSSAGLMMMSLAVQRKFGERSGLGLAPFLGFQPRRLDRWYTAAGLTLQWWRERRNRRFPGVTGWTLQAGPMATGYSFLRDAEVINVAGGGGVVGAASVYATVPLLHFLFDADPTGWIPHLTWEIGLWAGAAGPMKNLADTDVDGDGVIDHRDGERFENPDGRSPPALIGGLLVRSGIVWVF